MKKIATFLFALALTTLSFSQDDVKTEFISMLNGTEEAAEKAIATYCSSDVIENGMIPFGSNPKVTLTKENCLWFTLEDDGDINIYYICSEGDKIIEFDWADDEEDE